MDVNPRPTVAGNPKTKEFYDRRGWVYEDGVLVDTRLFGSAVRSNVRRQIEGLREGRILDALAHAGAPLDLIEFGCGGNPALFLLPACRRYTGVDFSSTGLAVARERLRPEGVPFDTSEQDICRLSFEDERFDAAYSAHVLYHIDDPEAQAEAFRQIMRVIRSGGVAVFILANPRPLSSPIRLLRRLVADTPVLGSLVDRLRTKPPLPYKPMPLGWMRRVLEPSGEVDITVHALPHTLFAQRVSDGNAAGRLAWRIVGSLERRWPRMLARWGNYVQITVRKR